MSKQDGRNRLVSDAPVADETATILHVDLDAFYASVELLERPELVGRPVIVGHASARSVVTAANYEARQFGVNSAMSMALALQRCPQAIVLEPHFERYQHYSALFMTALGEISPLVEPLGIDEAFVDIAGARRLFGTPWQIATRLRADVFDATGLRASVGAASTKYVAKLASGRAKPNGQLVVPADDTLAFLHPQPISALWGVGAKTEEQLARLGLRTIGDLAQLPIDTLRHSIGDAGAARLHELAWGRDPRVIAPGRDEKSVGHETTFETDVVDPSVIHRTLLQLADGVGVRLRRSGVRARTVSLKLRFSDFTTITRSRTLADATDVGRRLSEEVRALYDAANTARRPVRLVGVRAEQLTGDLARLSLWDDDEAWRDAETTVDELNARFGDGSVRSAALLRGTRTRRFGHGD
ncbi:DNA polymerase IV [uncultured Schumannella sp.]|uniref:DNA polymerase IV n=1 Tax=uncultured Schumannella sp. TaxID=1195956 RepID=UPI0025E1BDA3|nr:DNA polymerase IV [uncultured Schumannella sp.]